MNDRLARLRVRLGAPVDGASLAALRIAFGLVMAFAACRFGWMGWIDELYVAPRHHLHYFGFGWVEPLPAPWIHLHFAGLALSALSVAVGFRYRLAIVAVLVLFGWVELLDAATYLNHYYAITLVGVLLALTPAERVLSFDAWWAARRGAPLPTTVPTAAVWALRAQLGVVYVFAGIAKLNADWLLEAEPLRTWLLARSDFPVLGPLLELEGTAYAMSWAGALFDLSIPFVLLHERTRAIGYALVVGFHALTYGLFPQIGVFPLVMVALTPIFFSPEWPRVLARRRSPPIVATRALPRWVIPALGAWMAIQIVLPLRHLAYDGDVLFTQEGMRWAWHVMVAERGASLELTAIDDAGGRWIARPEDYLTPLQARMASTEPDLLLQLAHLVRDDHAARGRHVRVYADAWVAVNGHRSRRLVDPGVDLAAEEDGLGEARWVLRD